jgi:hypothetical protein
MAINSGMIDTTDLPLTAVCDWPGGSPLFTPSQVAGWLRIDSGRLSVWRRDGIGPLFVEIEPGVVRYRESDLLVWLRENRHLTKPRERSRRKQIDLVAA